MRLHRTLRLAASVLLAAFAAQAGERRLELTDAWKFERIWKTAAGKSHFYKGQMGFRNRSDAIVEQIRARIHLLDPGGERITSSETLRFGSLRPGASETENFEIPKSIQFAELRVEVRYRVAGEEASQEFSSTKGERPAPSDVDMASNVLELRILSHEIEQPVSGKGVRKHTYLTCRVKNLAAVPAKNPTVTVTFKEDPAAQKKRKRKKKPLEPIEVLLEEGEIAPGETETYKKVKIPGAVEYVGYSLAIRATWPELPDKKAPAFDPGELRAMEGTPFSLGGVVMDTEAEDAPVLLVPVRNEGEALEGGRLKITLHLQDAQGNPVETLTHVSRQPLPRGETVVVRIPAKGLPPFQGYEIAVEW